MYAGGCINVAGAGDADLIDMAVDRLVDHFLADDCLVRDLQGTQRKIESVLFQLFEDQARRNSFLNPDERPWAELLIGVRASNGKELLKCSGTKIKRIRDACCIGTGVLVANNLVKELFDQNMTLKQAGLLAIYTLYRAKRTVDGVGGNTDILFLGNWGLTRISADDVQKIESWWSGVEDAAVSFARALTGPNPLDRAKVATLADFKDSIAFYDEIYGKVDEILNPEMKPEPGMMVTKIFPVSGTRIRQEEGVPLPPEPSTSQKSEPEP